MLNVDWSKAPEWAYYAAKDADGKWHWYELEPVLKENMWDTEFTGRYLEFSNPNVQWTDTLQERPQGADDSGARHIRKADPRIEALEALKDLLLPSTTMTINLQIEKLVEDLIKNPIR